MKKVREEEWRERVLKEGESLSYLGLLPLPTDSESDSADSESAPSRRTRSGDEVL